MLLDDHIPGVDHSVGVLLKAEVNTSNLVQRLLEHAVDPGVAHLLDHCLAVVLPAPGTLSVDDLIAQIQEADREHRVL